MTRLHLARFEPEPRFPWGYLLSAFSGCLVGFVLGVLWGWP